jgi:hypothetical protein
VTTNKIKQVFNRRIVEQWTEREAPLSIAFAVPDHPWYQPKSEAASNRKKGVRKKDSSAAIRIAMTVAERGSSSGILRKVVAESDVDTDAPQITFDTAHGVIHSNLTTGVDVTKAAPLLANEGLACNGMMLAGKGFKVSRTRAADFTEASPASAEYIRPYIGGSEILKKPKNMLVIDFFGLTESQARTVAPEAYAHLLATVKVERDKNRRPALKNRWWVFAEPRSTLRPALSGLARYMATTESSKYRVFQFLDTSIVPDHMIIAIALQDYYSLGVLSSSIHLEWTYANCGLLGVARFANTHRYTKSKCFDSFPFPEPEHRIRQKISELAEELDSVRQTALVDVEKMTITELYNLREKVRTGQSLKETEQRRATRARVAIIGRLHEQLDQAVAEAYGWADEWDTGTITQSEIVLRLFALNQERASAENGGDIRWLRPDYQEPRFGKK